MGLLYLFTFYSPLPKLTLLCCLGDSCLHSLLIDYTYVCDLRMCLYMYICARAPHIISGNGRDPAYPRQISVFCKKPVKKNSDSYHIP